MRGDIRSTRIDIVYWTGMRSVTNPSSNPLKGMWSGVSDPSHASPVHDANPGTKHVSSHTSLINNIVTPLWSPYWNDAPVHKSCTLRHNSYLYFNLTNLEFFVLQK